MCKDKAQEQGINGESKLREDKVKRISGCQSTKREQYTSLGGGVAIRNWHVSTSSCKREKRQFASVDEVITKISSPFNVTYEVAKGKTISVEHQVGINSVTIQGISCIN